MKIDTARLDKIRRRSLFAVVVAVALAPLPFSFLKLVGFAFGFSVPPVPPAVQWGWIASAYVVCFCACLHVGAVSQSKGIQDELDMRLSWATSFFAAMTAFCLCVGLCFGIAIVTDMSFKGVVVSMPLVLLSFGGLFIGDIFGCPRFLR